MNREHWIKPGTIEPDLKSRALDEVVIDLADLIHIDDFDMVVRAIADTVEKSPTLSLDDADDRAALIARLQLSIGTIVGRWSLRIGKRKLRHPRPHSKRTA